MTVASHLLQQKVIWVHFSTILLLKITQITPPHPINFLVKICKIQPPARSFISCYLFTFYISRYHFSQILRTSFNLISKKDRLHNFSFSNRFTHPPPSIPTPPLSPLLAKKHHTKQKNIHNSTKIMLMGTPFLCRLGQKIVFLEVLAYFFSELPDSN